MSFYRLKQKKKKAFNVSHVSSLKDLIKSENTIQNILPDLVYQG